MKTARKAIMLVLCVVLLVVASVMGTLAYLTDTKEVVNTFTVGKVQIDLDEQDTDNSTADEDRDKANEYHLLPGKEYVKDPTIHVVADSENCYLFIKVVNEITAIEATANETLDDGTNYVPVATQILNNGWIAMGDGVYYKEWIKGTSAVNQPVFANFKISDIATNTQMNAHAPETTGEGENAVTTYKNIKVTAYAIQMSGFEPTIAEGATVEEIAAAKLASAKQAWNAGNQPTTNGGWEVG